MKHSTHFGKRSAVRAASRNILSPVMAGAALALWALCAAPSAADEANHGVLFGALMDSWQEVPAINIANTPKGVVGLKLNPACDTITLFGAVQDLSGTATKFHMHAGARGAAGPVAYDFMPFMDGHSIAADWTGFTDQDVRRMLRSGFYLNVHTAANAGGELRGQVEPQRDLSFTADLASANEVPPAAAHASGVAGFQLSPDDSILTVKAKLQGLTDSITAAHIHQGPNGANGSVVADLMAGLSTAGGAGIDFKVHIASLADPKGFIDSLKKGSLYINVHTKTNKSGEMRGQILPAPGIAFVASLKGGNENPATASTATGLGMFRLSDDDSSLTVNVVFGALQDSVTLAHLHRAAPGSNGGVVVNLSSGISGNSVNARIAISSLPDPAGFLADLVKGNIYVNVHSKANPSGEIRGQLLMPVRSGVAFRMSPAQEVPAASATAPTAIGAGFASIDIDGANLAFDDLTDGLSSAFKMGHIHKGAAGSNGGVVQDLTARYSNGAVHGVWTDRDASPFTSDLADAFRTGLLYMNVHTANNASGEIRGQMLDAKAGKALTAGMAPRRLPAARPYARLAEDGRSIRLDGPAGTAATVTVLDMEGRVAFKAQARFGADALSNPVDISSLKTGVYHARWRVGSELTHATFFVH